MAALRLLSVAVASGRIGCTFFIDGKLKDWRMSYVAAKSAKKAASITQKWIDELCPDVVVTEKPEKATRKSAKSKAIIEAVANTTQENKLLDVCVEREQPYANKYEEAEALAKRYPELEAWRPKKRRFFNNEPRNTVLFEAIALAESILASGSTSLAAAMG